MSFSSPSALLAGLALAGAALLPISGVLAEPGHDEIPTTITLLPAPLEVETEAAPEAPLGTVSNHELTCLARVIDHEAAGQPLEGQIAVAHVMLNRVRSSRFPDTLCAVAYQPKQFSYIHRHQIRETSARWQSALDVARNVLAGKTEDTSGGALFFHARRIKPNSFFRTRTRVASVEDHIFYR
jgi:spore germination cell wall hydrolase CwlJ-like protein